MNRRWDLESAQAWISSGKNVNQLDSDGRTLLSWATINDRTPIVEKLLEKGVNINEQDTMGFTPLISAIWNASPTIAILLIEKGADIEASDKNKSTPLIHAVVHGELDNQLSVVVQKLLEKGANIEARDKNESTPLIYAARDGRLLVVQKLIEKGANIDAQDNEGYTALSMSLVEEHFEIAMFLVEKGANVNLPYKEGYTPLFFACRTGETPLIEKLLEKGANIEQQNSDGRTPLIDMSKYGRPDITKLLIEKGANIDAQDKKGYTALILTIAAEEPDVANVLIEKGANLNLQSISGNTALIQAVSKGDIDIVNMLIEKGANLDMQYGNGDTALIWASVKGYADIVEMLVEKGANKTIRNKAGKTAMDLAASDDIRELLEDKDKSALSEPWKGYSKSDIDLMHQIFDAPSDISMCPVCLEYSTRIDGCMYMTHRCKKPRHEQLYKLFNSNGVIEWCTLCGRISSHHHHFELSLPTITTLPPEAKVKPTSTGQFRFFDKDCVASGGGGHDEKIRRFNALFLHACELQDHVGKISKEDAVTEIVGEMWLAASSKSRVAKKIIADKKFTFPCAFPEDAETTTRPDAPVFPDIPRPADEKELTPVKHDTPDNECLAELGPHEDNRPVYQFRHKQPDGTIYEHKGEYLCGADLEEAIRANEITGKCPINPTACKSKLYPEEVKGIVTDTFYEVYRTNFNRANAVAVGGGETGLFRRADDALCSLPPKTGGKRRVVYPMTFRAKKHTRRRRTHRK